MDHVITLISDLLVEKYQYPADAVTPAATFESLEVDSLVLIELAVVLQSRLGVDVADGELVVTQTIAQAAELVSAKVAA